MTAAVVVEVLVPCTDCRGQGYDADGHACIPCKGRGSFDLVECPAHHRKVARDHTTGRLLGRCDGCMTDAAQALTSFTTTNTNGRAGSVFAESASAAEEVTL